MRSGSSGLTAFVFLILAVGGFGAVLWFNASGSTPLAPVLPTESQPTNEAVPISQLLNSNFGSNVTAQPTVDLPQIQPTRPIVAQPSGPTATPIRAADASSQSGDTAAVAPIAVTPTRAPATVNAPRQSGTLDPAEWNPPALIPPLSLDPLGRDHYWFRRPVESNGNNRVLLSYPYGTGGIFGSRIHHGIDMPNPIGEEVFATAAGEVVFASDGRTEGGVNTFQNTSVYGNVVFIKHDFGFDGQPLYTLYAHLLTALVSEGDRVQAGDPIGLVGATGAVTGPHVHFEVRLGGDRYGDTYNPTLWMVPYVGHGVIAGRVVDRNGEFLDEITVTIRSRQIGTPIASVPTYTFQNTVDDVNPDPNWRENFAVGDIPVGRYDVIATIDGQRVVTQVDVFEGMTSFVELRLPDPVPSDDDETDDTN